MGALPMLGNLAWAPMPAIENVEVLDRFNGVPTLGLFSAEGERALFWRALGYVPGAFSIWIYVPLDEAAERRLGGSERGDLLEGLIFESPVQRYVTVGVAGKNNRLVFEREWNLPGSIAADDLIGQLLDFLNEAFDIMLRQDLPPSRRELMRNMSQAVGELATA
jgi:hypothetical protein